MSNKENVSGNGKMPPNIRMKINGNNVDFKVYSEDNGMKGLHYYLMSENNNGLNGFYSEGFIKENIVQ